MSPSCGSWKNRSDFAHPNQDATTAATCSVMTDEDAKQAAQMLGHRGSSYDEDYRAISELKSLADHLEGAVKVIHHTRKGTAEDPFDEVSGTLGIIGAADSIMVLYMRRVADSAALYITSRDLPDQSLSLKWNPEFGLWALLDPNPHLSVALSGSRH
jgi:hypothetical protein